MIRNSTKYMMGLRKFFVCFLAGAIVATGLFSGLHGDRAIGIAPADEIVSSISDVGSIGGSQRTQDQHEAAHCSAISCAVYLTVNTPPTAVIAHAGLLPDIHHATSFFSTSPKKPPIT